MKKQLMPLYKIACNESYELEARYAAARQMVALREQEKPAQDIPASIIRGLWYRQQRKRVART